MSAGTEALMDYPAAVVEKAKCLESLLQRVEAGEPFEPVLEELGLQVEAAALPKLFSRYESGGRNWEVLLDGRYGHSQNVNSAQREWLYQRKRQDESLTAPALAAALEREFGVGVAAGHINYLLRKVALTRSVGRPVKRRETQTTSEQPGATETSLENAGLFFPGGGQAGDGDCGGRAGQP